LFRQSGEAGRVVFQFPWIEDTANAAAARLGEIKLRIGGYPPYL
jgi:hypothetical protein